ncbi:N-6 DNA methylase [uncultured Sphingomonas sp.]|uniref:class I SAM-dependent DNA methyltransferase n=1 Tax=uncultured Sphingomonas sp. TaxID=158754 RepID=UPI0035C94B00
MALDDPKATRAELDAAVWGACDVMRRSNVAGALQYVPELSWLLFLRVLDAREEREAGEAEAFEEAFAPSLTSPYRWRDWAAPKGTKRVELQSGALNAFKGFVDRDLLPHLRSLRDLPGATPRQKVIGEIVTGTERTRIDTDRNLADVLDRLDKLDVAGDDYDDLFPLSQVYEGLLLKMGEKGNDGGQFFTPRDLIRAVVKVIDPKPGETIYDPCCGTAGFLIEAFKHVREGLDKDDRSTGADVRATGSRRLYGREKENLVFPIALANLVLHGIDAPNLWHGNTLSEVAQFDGLWERPPELFDVVVTNPPFGGQENTDVQSTFDYRTSATQVLFLQHIIKKMADGGRCGIVVDEGVMFRTNENAFVQTKRRLLDTCDLWAVVSLPSSTFTATGAGVKTNLLFFTKGKPTERTWYYDLSDVKVTKKKPLTLASFDDFLARLPGREDSERSWTVEREAIEARKFDLKAVNPNRKVVVDPRTPIEIVGEIEAAGAEAAAAIARLRALLG